MTTRQLSIAEELHQQDKKEWDSLKRSSKSYEACQQSCLLGLLNLIGFSFTIEKVYKKSTKTLPLLNVTYLSGCKQIDMKEVVANQIQSMSSASPVDYSKKKWSERLKKRSVTALAFNILLDVCQNENFTFKLKNTRKAEYTVVMQKVKSVEFSSALLNGCSNYSITLNKESVRKFGTAVNQYILSGMDGSNRKMNNGETSIYIDSYDRNIKMMLMDMTVNKEKLTESENERERSEVSAFTPISKDLIEVDESGIELKSFSDNSY